MSDDTVEEQAELWKKVLADLPIEKRQELIGHMMSNMCHQLLERLGMDEEVIFGMVLLSKDGRVGISFGGWPRSWAIGVLKDAVKQLENLPQEPVERGKA